MLLTDAGFHKSAGAYLTIIKSTLSGPFWYFLGRKNTHRDAKILIQPFWYFLGRIGTQPANNSSSDPKKQPKTNSSKSGGRCKKGAKKKDKLRASKSEGN
jgi:hypothetical protein